MNPRLYYNLLVTWHQQYFEPIFQDTLQIKHIIHAQFGNLFIYMINRRHCTFNTGTTAAFTKSRISFQLLVVHGTLANAEFLLFDNLAEK